MKSFQTPQAETKIEMKLDNNNTYLVGKYGPVIKCVEEVDGKEEITFKPIKKDMDIHKIENGDLSSGSGPVLTYGPAVQNNLLKLIIKAAEKNKIPFQRAAASRATGTDTDAFAYSNEGVPSALISLPLRYMHTTVEMCRKEDVENAIQLIYESVLSIKAGQDFRYIK